MADLLGAANRVPGYEVSNQHTAGTAIQAGDRQVKNVPDPTRVGRVDARNDQQGADNALASDVLRYDSNLQAFLQSLREAPELPAVLRRTMTLLRSTVQTPGLQAGIAQELAGLLQMLRLDPESFSRFFMNQVHGNNRFAGPLFSLLRQAYGTLPGEQARTAVLEFARRYSDFSSTEHIGKSMLSLLRQMEDCLPKSWRGQLEALTARLENGLAAQDRGENVKLLEGEVIPYLGSYVERTHDLGTLRGLLSLLILQVARYENGSEEQMLQAFRQMEGYGGVLGGLNQLDDAAILKLLRGKRVFQGRRQLLRRCADPNGGPCPAGNVWSRCPGRLQRGDPGHAGEPERLSAGQPPVFPAGVGRKSGLFRAVGGPQRQGAQGRRHGPGQGAVFV